MRRLLAIALFVAACGGATTSSVPNATANAPSPTADAASPTTTPSSSAGLTATPIDADLVQKFKAAVVRMNQTRPNLDDPDLKAWPVVRAHFIKLADWYDAFSLDLEAISFPEKVVGQHSAHLIGWSKELAKLLRQIAASASFEAAMQDTVVFEGSSYPVESFLKDATGEWGASLSLTADALGVDLASL